MKAPSTDHPYNGSHGFPNAMTTKPRRTLKPLLLLTNPPTHIHEAQNDIRSIRPKIGPKMIPRYEDTKRTEPDEYYPTSHCVASQSFFCRLIPFFCM